MHLGIYEFTGNPKELLAGYDRLMTAIPQGNVSWHLCAVREDGITIYDTCPSEAVFESFSTNPGFHEAIANAGLPARNNRTSRARRQSLADQHRITRSTAGNRSRLSPSRQRHFQVLSSALDEPPVVQPALDRSPRIRTG